jgi:NACHT domain
MTEYNRKLPKNIIKLINSSYKSRVADYLNIQMFQMRNPIQLDQIYITPSFITSEDIDIAEDHIARGRRAYGHNISKNIDELSIYKPGARSMILGDPGAGKSSLLRMILANSIDVSVNDKRLKTGSFPIYLELRRVAEHISKSGYTSIVDYFAESFDNDRSYLTDLEEICKSYNVIFLLDALDEVPRDMLSSVLDLIYNTSQIYPNSAMLISSRIGEKTRLKGFTVHEISDFSEEERQVFVNKWFAINNALTMAPRLISAIAHTPAIAEITTNPLLLSLICILFKNDHNLPNQRSEVFERCIQILVREWDTEREFRRSSQFSALSDEKHIQILSEIASYYLKQSRRYFGEDELARFVEHIQEEFEIEDADPREMIKEICSHYGIIVPAGYANYGFSHLSFQEYLTARYAVKMDQFDSLLVDYAENKRWLETVLFAAGRIGSFGLVFDGIKDNQDLTDHEKFGLIGMILRRTNITIDIEYRHDLFDYIFRYFEEISDNSIVFPRKTSTNTTYSKNYLPPVSYEAYCDNLVILRFRRTSLYNNLYQSSQNLNAYSDPLFLISYMKKRAWFRQKIGDYLHQLPASNYKKLLKILSNPNLEVNVKVHSKEVMYEIF